MANYKLTLAYDGTHFLGWQKTPMGRSIESTLQAVLEQILQHPVNLQAASRTDAGVHADEQVVNFFSTHPRITPQSLLVSLRALLPKDIAVIDLTQEKESFHPTLLAKGKVYRYILSCGPYQQPQDRLYSWHYPYSLDLKQMQEESRELLGCHDFSTFCNDKEKMLKNPYCFLEEIHIEKGPFQKIFITLKGNRFLYKMVRNIVGTLAEIGSGKIKPNALKTILLSRDRTQAGVTAPPHGLFLIKIIY